MSEKSTSARKAVRRSKFTVPEVFSQKTIKINVNRKDYVREVKPRVLLVDFLRDNLGLTGTHVGCDTSNCGACTVILNGRSVKSCSIFAIQADGADILTIEGLAKENQYHPLQQAFWDNHGLQCGFCTPGIIMEAYWFLRENPHPSEEQIRWGIAGNLCRCTGYANIVKAIEAASEKMSVEQMQIEQPQRKVRRS